MEEWSNEDMVAFIKVIKNVCLDVLREEGIPCFISAIVTNVYDDGKVDVYLPPDKNNVVTGKINKTGEVLKVGDSVELLCKKGHLSDSWVAVKHGIGEPMTTTTSGTNNNVIDYNSLINLPKINGAVLKGEKTTNDLGLESSDKTFVHIQSTPSAEWTITHNLNKYPSIIIVDNNFIAKMGEIKYLGMQSVQISFDQPFAGRAFLN